LAGSKLIQISKQNNNQFGIGLYDFGFIVSGFGGCLVAVVVASHAQNVLAVPLLAVLGLALPVPGFGFWVPGLVLRVPGSGFHDAGSIRLGFSGLGFRVQDSVVGFKPQTLNPFKGTAQ